MTQLEKYLAYFPYCGTKYGEPDGRNEWGAPKRIYTCAQIAILKGERVLCSYEVCPEFGRHAPPIKERKNAPEKKAFETQEDQDDEEEE